MKDHPAIAHLESIIKESDEKLRLQLLSDWKESWLYSIEKNQYVINKSIMSTEETDFVWEWISKQCIDDVLENDIASTRTTNNSFSVELLTLRSSNAAVKKNPENT